MSDTTIRDQAAHIYSTASTRDKLRRLKRGGQTYDELLRRMVEQNEPDNVVEDSDGSA